MSGAAWKLTALSASLAVGFFGLMKVQQQLSPSSEPAAQTESAQDDTENLPEAELLTAADFEEAESDRAESTQTSSADDAPFFSRDEVQNVPQNKRAAQTQRKMENFQRAQVENPSGNEFQTAQFEPEPASDDPFAAAPPPSQSEPEPAEEKELADNQSEPSPSADPFADFRPEVHEKMEQTQNNLKEAQRKFERNLQETGETARAEVDAWQDEVVQTADIVKVELNNLPKLKLLPPAQPEPQANDSDQERIQLTAAHETESPERSPAGDTDVPPPFLPFENKQAKPIEQADSNSEPASAGFPAANPADDSAPSAIEPPAMKETETSEAPASPFGGFPPAETEVATTSAEKSNESDTKESSNAPAGGFPSFSPTAAEEPAPNETEEPKPAAENKQEPVKVEPLPEINPGTQFPKSSASEPAEISADAPTSEVEEEASESLPRVTPQGGPAEPNDANAPSEGTSEPQNSSRGSFFPGFNNSNQTSTKTADADDPYRTIPDFNTKPMPPEPVDDGPAPFQLTPPETNREPTSTPEVPEETQKKTEPADPFGASPVPLPEENTTKPQERPSDFPSFPGPDSAGESEPAGMNSSEGGSDEPSPFSPEPEPQQPESSQPEPKPEMTAPESQPEPPASNPSPFDFGNLPEETATPEPVKPDAIEPAPGKSPAPMNVRNESPTESNPLENIAPEKPVIAPDDDLLIGAARVDEQPTAKYLQPKIELNKSAPENAVLGQPLIYSIEIQNTGDVGVKDVTVEDKFPAGTKLTGTIPRAELVDKTLVWRFDSLNPHEKKKILVRVVPIESGKIGSVSTVSYKSTVSSQTIVTAPKIEFSMQATPEVAVDETVDINFLVKNTGKGDAQNVILRNLIPEGLDHPAGSDLEYEIGELKGGAEKEISLTMVAKSVGTFENVATIRADGDISVESKVTVKVIKSVMNLTHQGPTRRFIGQSAKYKTVVRNDSSRTLNNVQVTTRIPPGFAFTSADQDGTYDGQQRRLSWTIPTLEAQQSVSLNSELKPESMGTHTLLVNAEDRSGHVAEVSSAVKVEGFPSLSVRLPDAAPPVTLGERVSLRFKVVNRGSAEATKVRITCKMPDQLNFLSTDGPVTSQQNGKTIEFETLEKLKPDEEASFDIVFTAKSEGDARVEFKVSADEINNPLTHEEQVVIYGN